MSMAVNRGRESTRQQQKIIYLPKLTSIVLSGRVAQSVGHRTRKSGVLGSIHGLATYFVSPSAFSRRAVVSYWRKYVHEVLVNRLIGLILPRKNLVTLTDRLDMTLDVYRGRKTTIQQQPAWFTILLEEHQVYRWFNNDKIRLSPK